MPRLAVADTDQINAIYRESFSLWGAGLSFDDYLAFWNDLGATAWAKNSLSYLVWTDDDAAVLSSLKLYRPRLTLFGETGTAAGVGAVFTPHAHRRKGHATAMLKALVDQARERGDLAALLFSDVGTAIYGALGFRPLPSEEAWGKLPRRLPAPPDGFLLRPMMHSDLGKVREAHHAICRSRPISVLRNRDHWDYLLERSRSFFARLDGTDLSTRFQVMMHEDRFAGYLVSVASGNVWIVREVETAGDVPEVLRAVLLAGAAQARARGLRQVYGWLPTGVAEVIPEWRLSFRPRRRAIPMLLPLGGDPDLASLDSVDAAFIPYLDQF